MHQIKTSNLKLTWWPTPQDYNEAIQIPRANLSDPELKTGLVYSDALGLPRPVTGSFASVYRMHCAEKDYALRLFLRNVADQEARYKLISDFVQSDDLPYTVTFHFLTHGIKMMGNWLPCLKMEWVEGTQLDDYVVENLANPQKIGELANKFLVMMTELRRAGIAHGDLQHGNIIVCDGELRLVDYDGMFVPRMEGFQASELGHRNYQHPARRAEHFGPYLDNFSAWIIYTSLKALEIDSRLMHQLGVGDDCLLFKQTDFIDPTHSPAFAALENHGNAQLRDLARFIRSLLVTDPQNIPPLQADPPALHSKLVPLSDSASVVRQGPRLERVSHSDWLNDKNISMLKSGDVHHSTASGAVPQLSAQSWVVKGSKPTSPQWIKPTHPTIPAALRGIPPELQMPAPRQVEFRTDCGKANPRVLQALMLLNPLVWLFLYYFFQLFLPSPQTNYATLLLFYSVLFIIVMVQELLIWLPANQQKKLVENGTGVLGKVVGKRIDTSASRGYWKYKIMVSYLVEPGNFQVRKELEVAPGQYDSFSVGNEELLIYDASNPYIVGFYNLLSHRSKKLQLSRSGP